MTASIGPYTFLTMEGRTAVASSPTVVTDRGIKPGKPRPQPTQHRTVEEPASFLDAWVRASWYRAAIGAVTTIIDDGGVVTPVALIADVRTKVVAGTAGAGATLETTWTLCPAIGFGDYGTAQDYIDVNQTARVLTQAPTAPIASSLVRVGGITFIAATGDLQWPITKDQGDEVVAGAKSIGADNVVSAPSLSQGTLECYVECLNEQAGFDLMRICRIMVGTYVDVELGGVIIPLCAVKDVSITWIETKAGTSPNTRTAMVVWALDTQEDSGSGDTLPTASNIQISTDFSSWKRIDDAYCANDEEGLSGAAGQVTWLLDLGVTMRGRRSIVHEPTDYSGQWCRVLKRTTLDGRPSPKGTTLTPMWYGEILSSDVIGGAGEGTATMIVTCGGLMSAMLKCWPTRWYETAQDGLSEADPGEVLKFNDIPGGDMGSQGNATGEINAATAHDRYRIHTPSDSASNPSSIGLPNPTPWTAHQEVLAWLAALRAQYPDAPNFALDGQVTALDYVDAKDLRLRSYGAGLVELISLRSGLAFRLEVTSTTVTVRVVTGVADDTVIPGLGTFPMNDRKVAVDLSTPNIVRFNVNRSRQQQVDRILINCGRPWYCMTLGINTAGNRDYQLQGPTADQQAAWTAASAEARNSDTLSLYWRRFRLRDDWRGGGYFSTHRNDALKMTRTLATDATHGVGGETGEVQLPGDGTNILPKAATLRFTRDLPLWTGKDWAAVTGSGTVDTSTTPGNQHEGPLLFGRKADGSYEILHNRWQVQIENDAPGVILGQNATHAAQIKAYLDAGNTILITLGMLAPLPWRVSWRRDPAERPRTLERCIQLDFPDIYYRVVFSGTALGLSSPTALKQAANDVRLDWETAPNSGIAKPIPWLKLARLWHENKVMALTWTDQGVLDGDVTKAPGSMVTTSILRLDRDRTYTETINAVITARARDYKGIATSYTAERLLPGFDRVSIAKAIVGARINPGKLLGLGY